MAMAASANHRSESAIYIWVGSFVLVGFVVGSLFQHHAFISLLLANTLARATASEHLWDAVCVGLAIAAIATGLLADQRHPDYDSCSTRRSPRPAFDDFMSQLFFGGLPALHHYCHIIDSDDDGFLLHCCCSADHDSAVAPRPLIEASADMPDHQVSIAGDSQAPLADAPPYSDDRLITDDRASIPACNHNDLLQASSRRLCPDAAALHVQAAPMACSHEVSHVGEDKTVAADAEESQFQSECSEITRMGDDCAGVADVKLAYGVLQELQRAAGSYGVQARQAGGAVANYEHFAEEECAEINRKADAFIASFREQMRREMQRELMLCT